jgi:hypothetical protein
VIEPRIGVGGRDGFGLAAFSVPDVAVEFVQSVGTHRGGRVGVSVSAGWVFAFVEHPVDESPSVCSVRCELALIEL